jgi:hypothetical protein
MILKNIGITLGKRSTYVPRFDGRAGTISNYFTK